MNKIIFLKGLPASGKSTWANTYCFNDLNTIRLNKDEIREELGNLPWSREFEAKVLETQRTRGLKYIELGKSLIIDDTNFASKHEDYWREVAKKYNYEFEIKVFDTPVDECIRRDATRQKSVGYGVIMDMYKKYIKPNYLKFDDRFILKQNNKLDRAIICDLDGTLALINGRSPFADNYSSDILNESVSDIISNYWFMGYDIILLSGRMETGRASTISWLKDKGIEYTHLYMRAANDYRSDNVVKKELYEKYIKDQYYIDFILDDRDSVVKMWRELGLLCLQVYYGDF